MIPSFFPRSAPLEVPSGEKRNGSGPSQKQGALGFPFCFSLGWCCLTLTHKITWFFKFSIHENGGKLGMDTHPAFALTSFCVMVTC